ncbi:MAG: TetR/AcrR family transcriptional regulator [Thermodesulfobacteriota bacterium]
MGLKERKAREKQARRRQIIDAARSLLFEKGLQATSINQIAKRAELAVGTIYFYYASKEELFAELQEEGLQLLMEKVRQATSTVDDPKERLRAMAMAYYDFSQDHKDYFDIISYFLSSPNILLSADLKQRVDQRMEKILEIINATFARGLDAGTFGEYAQESRGVLVLAAFHGLMQFRKFETTVFKGVSHRDLYSSAVGQLLDGLAQTSS